MSINKDTVHELVGVFYQPPFKTFYINSIDGESFVTPQGVFVSLGITTSMSVLESIRNVLEKSSGFTARLCMIKSRKVAGQFLNIVMPVKESDIKQFNMEVFPPGCMNKQESEDELSRLMSEIPENEEQKDVDGIYDKISKSEKLEKYIKDLSESPDGWENHIIQKTSDNDYKIFHKRVNYKKSEKDESEYRIGIYVTEV